MNLEEHKGTKSYDLIRRNGRGVDNSQMLFHYVFIVSDINRYFLLETCSKCFICIKLSNFHNNAMMKILLFYPHFK